MRYLSSNVYKQIHYLDWNASFPNCPPSITFHTQKFHLETSTCIQNFGRGCKIGDFGTLVPRGRAPVLRWGAIAPLHSWIHPWSDWIYYCEIILVWTLKGIIEIIHRVCCVCSEWSPQIYYKTEFKEQYQITLMFSISNFWSHQFLFNFGRVWTHVILCIEITVCVDQNLDNFKAGIGSS